MIVRPTFIGVGVQKCATTWLHRILEEHPDIGVPSCKEIDFFSRHYDHGYAWYERWFEGCRQTAVGEVSPSYFHEPAVPERVGRFVPDVKIVAIFRDPVERALSNHRHEVRVGHLTGPDLSLEAGLENNPTYVDQGRYATHLQRWFDSFPQSRILTLLTDDIREDPAAVAARTYEFLGVDPTHRPRSLERRPNRSFANRHRALSTVKDRLYGMTRAPSLRWLWTAGVRIGGRAAYRRLNVIESSDAIPAPKESTIVGLREEFTPEVRKLSGMIGRSLEHWL